MPVSEGSFWEWPGVGDVILSAAVHRVALQRRAAEISDELAELDWDDVNFRARINKLRQP